MTERPDELQLRQVTRLLRRRWKLVTVFVLAGAAAAAALGLMLPPSYTAKAQLLYETEIRDGVEVVDDAAIETLAQLLISPGHLRRIESSLIADSRPAGTVDDGDGEPATPVPTVEQLERHLDAYKERGSRLISVTFQSEDPEGAAAVANRAVELYFQLATNWRTRAREAALENVNDGIVNAQANLDRAEAELRAARRAYGIVPSERADQIDVQIAELHRQRSLTQAVLDMRRAELQRLDVPGGGASEPFDTGEADGDGARIVVAASEADGAIGRGTRSAPVPSPDRQRLMRDVGAEEARLQQLDGRLQALRRAGTDSDAALSVVHGIERRVATARQLHEALLLRKADLTAQVVGRLPVRLLSAASIPARPSSPPPLLFLLPAIVAAGLVGSALAIVLEKMDRRLYSARDVEEALGVPCIGLIPSVPRKRGRSPQDILNTEPFAPYTEAIRSTVVASLHSGGVETEPKTFLITSTADGEGKTTLALSFASYAARLGRRVILVDLDLRRPGLLRLIGPASAADTVNFLDGGAPSKLIRTSPDHGIDYLALPEGSEVDPLALLTRERTRPLLSVLSRDYDCVVIDSGPAGIATETRLLASVVDRVIFAVRWGATEDQAARSALQGLLTAGPGRCEAVITQINLRRYRRYRYDEPGLLQSPGPQPA